MIPTREECLRLMDEHGMLSHIKDHSLQVTRVALFIAMELNKKGQTIDLSLVEAASLLHDVAKTESFRTKEDHAVAGAHLLKGLGYERVGAVVAEHVRLAGEKNAARVSAEEVVNYADKRVQHNRVVCLEERFRDLVDRYGKKEKASEQLEQIKKITMEIENKIFSILGISPAEIQNLQLPSEGSDACFSNRR